jgi:C4-dicarboxylate-specific signal transduction histidine kinase
MQVTTADGAFPRGFALPHVTGSDRSAAGYLLALAFVALALAATLVLRHFEVDWPSLFLFFAAVATATWFGGVGPGCVAIAASIPAGLYFNFAALHATAIDLDNTVLFAFFDACAVAGGILGARQRRAEDGPQRTHRQLESKARELASANATLQAEITERRRAEQALYDAQAELARITRLTTMGELAASIAHEINQPLTAVITTAGSCQRWLDGERPNIEEARAAARRIVRDSNRASEIIRSIRAIVCQAPPQRAPLDVNTVIRDAVSVLEGDLQKNRIAVRTDLAADMSCIRGDRTLLHQVFMNLITNAMESMSLVDGDRRQLRIESKRLPAGVVAVAVHDTGGGIQGVARERLFEPFVTTKANGMGLGLSLCRSIVEAHGGSLSAEQGEPTGAVFHITLTENGN